MKKYRVGVVGFGHRGRHMCKLASIFDCVEIAAGCDIRPHNWFETQWLSDKPMAEIKICEGKYHQVKRMFASIGNKVLRLRRVKMGALALDETLAEGECRELEAHEVEKLLLKD